MKLKLIAAILVSMLAANVASGQTASSDASQAAPVQDSKTIRIARSESLQSNKGSDQFFTGSVQVQQLFPGHDPARTSGGRVTFEPGARSAWHTHPLGQILIMTDGTGWIQQWGGPIEEIRKGDVIWIPPGVKLARRDSDDSDDAYRDTGTAQRQGREVVGEGDRRAVPQVITVHPERR